MGVVKCCPCSGTTSTGMYPERHFVIQISRHNQTYCRSPRREPRGPPSRNKSAVYSPGSKDFKRAVQDWSRAKKELDTSGVPLPPLPEDLKYLSLDATIPRRSTKAPSLSKASLVVASPKVGNAENVNKEVNPKKRKYVPDLKTALWGNARNSRHIQRSPGHSERAVQDYIKSTQFKEDAGSLEEHWEELEQKVARLKRGHTKVVSLEAHVDHRLELRNVREPMLKPLRILVVPKEEVHQWGNRVMTWIHMSVNDAKGDVRKARNKVREYGVDQDDLSDDSYLKPPLYESPENERQRTLALIDYDDADREMSIKWLQDRLDDEVESAAARTTTDLRIEAAARFPEDNDGGIFFYQYGNARLRTWRNLQLRYAVHTFEGRGRQAPVQDTTEEITKAHAEQRRSIKFPRELREQLNQELNTSHTYYRPHVKSLGSATFTTTTTLVTAKRNQQNSEKSRDKRTRMADDDPTASRTRQKLGTIPNTNTKNEHTISNGDLQRTDSVHFSDSENDHNGAPPVSRKGTKSGTNKLALEAENEILKAKLKGQDEELKSKDEELKSKDEELKSKDEELKLETEELKRNKALIEQYSKQVQWYKATVTRLERELETMNKDEDLQELRDEIKRLNKAIPTPHELQLENQNTAHDRKAERIAACSKWREQGVGVILHVKITISPAMDLSKSDDDTTIRFMEVAKRRFRACVKPRYVVILGPVENGILALPLGASGDMGLANKGSSLFDWFHLALSGNQTPYDDNFARTAYYSLARDKVALSDNTCLKLEPMVIPYDWIESKKGAVDRQSMLRVVSTLSENNTIRSFPESLQNIWIPKWTPATFPNWQRCASATWDCRSQTREGGIRYPQYPLLPPPFKCIWVA
ncbi:hypothetical protein EJ08DRAFT_712279 [Tothia fuscella]|uniref:Uncharacterized protein n=1 Tax=Tothia fuscella TaxID=1048955 RepID=A0A9P4NUF3_9PEZI|nr:hypothetical protein EJ08DRAFT_712279 [Tothia fuscella]